VTLATNEAIKIGLRNKKIGEIVWKVIGSLQVNSRQKERGERGRAKLYKDEGEKAKRCQRK